MLGVLQTIARPLLARDQYQEGVGLVSTFTQEASGAQNQGVAQDYLAID